MTHPSLFTSESVTEGHPDKVCDYVADAILDAHLEQDPRAHVACEVLAKSGVLILAGEITSTAEVDLDHTARSALREVGYDDGSDGFAADAVWIQNGISRQAAEIGAAVDKEDPLDQGAGDQGMVFGYATDETPERMPLPILLAHRLAAGLAEDRRRGVPAWLRPDGKTQVTVEYADGRPVRVTHLLVSTQHAEGTGLESIDDYIRSGLAPRVLGDWHHDDITFLVNPSGSFVHGGPAADCGLTGRKTIVDTYGGTARHGGGAFSGKDPSKVDRSGAYFARWAARRVVEAGLARRAEVQVSYAIGRPEPQSLHVETFGTGDPAEALRFLDDFDFRPGAIIEKLDLLRPIYRTTTNYGHFGRPGLPWEV